MGVEDWNGDRSWLPLCKARSNRPENTLLLASLEPLGGSLSLRRALPRLIRFIAAGVAVGRLFGLRSLRVPLGKAPAAGLSFGGHAYGSVRGCEVGESGVHEAERRWYSMLIPECCGIRLMMEGWEHCVGHQNSNFPWIGLLRRTRAALETYASGRSPSLGDQIHMSAPPTTCSLLAATCLVATVAGAAVTKGHLPLQAVQRIELAGPDYDRLGREDAARAAAGAPARIAVPNAVSLIPETTGTWEHLDGDRMMWRLRVLSPGAAHINIGFDRLALPSSAEMRIESLDGLDATDTITASTPLAEGEYWSPVIWGDEVIVEFTVDADQRRELEQGVSLSSINEGYRGLGGYRDGPFHTSGSCNVDAACASGDAWTCEIPSVGVYTVNGTWTCTGAMVNNTSEDGTPYFLTAEHCGVTAANDQSVVIYWNYENSSCRTPGSAASGMAGDGPLSDTSTGTLLRAFDDNTDFTLLELVSSPSESYGVAYAGWSRSASLPTVGAGIHHPNTAEKRISTPASVQHDSDPFYADSFWEVAWAEGVTQPGSSGSPLFNGEHQIIGQLCCGNSFCSAPNEVDWYGKSFASTWSKLSPYLDPTNTGQLTVDTLCGSGPCPWDLGGTGTVDQAALLALIALWGQASATADFDGSGTVDVLDLLDLLEHWGSCP